MRQVRSLSFLIRTTGLNVSSDDAILNSESPIQTGTLVPGQNDVDHSQLRGTFYDAVERTQGIFAMNYQAFWGGMVDTSPTPIYLTPPIKLWMQAILQTLLAPFNTTIRRVNPAGARGKTALYLDFRVSRWPDPAEEARAICIEYCTITITAPSDVSVRNLHF
jgi:hypothetical protein